MTDSETLRLYLEVGFAPAFLQQQMNDVMYLKYAQRQAESEPEKYPKPVPEVKVDQETKAFLYGYQELRSRFERLRCMFGCDDYEKFKTRIELSEVLFQIIENKSDADRIIGEAVTRNGTVDSSNILEFREATLAAKNGDILTAFGLKQQQKPFEAEDTVSERKRRLVANFIGFCRKEERLPTKKELLEQYHLSLPTGMVLGDDHDKDCRSCLSKELGIILSNHPQR